MLLITKEMVDNYHMYLIEMEKSPATIEKYIHDIDVFLSWTKGRDIIKPIVLEYKEYLKDNYCTASVNSYISALNSFFSFCGMDGLKVRTLRIQRQIFTAKDKELTKSEYIRMLSAAKKIGNIKMYLIMQTICSTGIRVSELKYITVESVKSRQAVINMKGKTRIIIIPDALCSMLLKYVKQKKINTGSIFLSKNSRPMDRTNIWREMKKLSVLAHVAKEKVFPHNLRHLFARTFYTIQKDIVRLADILGHSSVNTTRIYTMKTGDIHRRQIQELGLLLC